MKDKRKRLTCFAHKYLVSAVAVWLVLLGLTFWAYAAVTPEVTNFGWSQYFVVSATNSGGDKNSSNSVTANGNTITVTARGYSTSDCGQTSNSTDTVTVTLLNSSTAPVSFDLSFDTTVTTTVTAGTGLELASGGSLEFKVTSNSGASSAAVSGTITITNVKAVSTGAEVSTNFNPSIGGTLSVDGTALSANTSQTKASDHEYVLVATANEGFTFYGWMSVLNGKISSDAEMTYTAVEGSTDTIWPLFKKNESAVYYIKGVAPQLYYAYLDEAVDAAAGSGTIVVAESGTVYHSDGITASFEIPSGVTLLIPYDTAGTLITTDMKSYLLTSDAAKVLFRQLTMSSGTSITVESGGAICVGSQTYRQMTGQAGPYGAIVMDSDSNITVESGGTLYTWGYVFRGNNGAGTVTVESGGTMYENIAIMDYPGSASTALELYGGGIFPMRTYTIRNVEVPMTFNSGAKEYVFYSLYSGTLGIFSDNALFIGNDYKAPFQLGTETTLTKAYSAGKQYLTIDGDFWLNSFSITMNGISAATSKTSGFPVPSGYVLELTSGTLTLGDNVILTEGSKMTIASDATVNTNGKKLYVFDATDDAGAVSSKDVHGTAYTQVNEDAVLDINGELNISGGFYTSAGNASIISSGETGRVNLTTVSTATTVRIKTAKAKASTYDVNPAYLQNVNEAYVDTSSAKAGDYYQNIDGYWHHSADEHVVDPDGIKCIYCPAKVVAQTEVLVEGTETETDKKFFSLQEAIENTSDNFITMLADTTESTYTIDKAVTIDLNKFKVEVGGVASNVTVTGIDSGTNGFQSVPGTNLGSINVAAVAPEKAVNGKYYIAITDDGVTTFHRVAVAVTSCQFIYDKPNEKQYIVVQGTFKGTDQSVAELTDLGFKFTDTGSTTAGKSNLEVPSDKNYNGTEWSYYYGRDFDSSVTGKVTVQALMEFGQETTPFMSNPTEDLVGLYKTFLGEI